MTKGVVDGSLKDKVYVVNLGKAYQLRLPTYPDYMKTSMKESPQLRDEPLPTFLSGVPGQIDILRAESNNIHFNLATEAYIFNHLPLNNPVLFLWRNKPCIIIGKHQNPWKECKTQLLEEKEIALARR